MKIFTKIFMLLLTLSLAVSGAYAQVSISVSVGTPPPALPVYVQPACPNDGYLWQPGYWAYSQDDDDYYWVPGVWVAPPQPNLYWTPSYWGYEGGYYGFHPGYWGPHVGFYGGINYGYGYGGEGFVGGEWHEGGFRYNTAVVTVNTTIVHNTYVNTTVINNTTVVNRASFNGQGGVVARPTQQELAIAHEQHIQPTSEQLSHEQIARADKSQFSKVNNGRPVAAAMDRVHGNAFSPRGGAAPGTSQVRQNAVMARSQDASRVNGNPAQHTAAPAAIVQHPQPAQQSHQQQHAKQPPRQPHNNPPRPQREKN